VSRRDEASGADPPFASVKSTAAFGIEGIVADE
jgi:hypothetical protein